MVLSHLNIIVKSFIKAILIGCFISVLYCCFQLTRLNYYSIDYLYHTITDNLGVTFFWSVGISFVALAGLDIFLGNYRPIISRLFYGFLFICSVSLFFVLIQ
ncbi:hypothetical protein DID75_01485 [Candidatus Marinamargulisbacteria bacterium SCGC AG-410-N11]|nr:hypothetical protein DID75_01485 [Candidatus Marinamargulisbacteria bacterium SCGC AG-410-N11]